MKLLTNIERFYSKKYCFFRFVGIIIYAAASIRRLLIQTSFNFQEVNYEAVSFGFRAKSFAFGFHDWSDFSVGLEC